MQLRESWPHIVALCSIIIVGVFEAIEQALSNAPTLTKHLPQVGGWIHYVPLALLTLAGLSWLYGSFRRKRLQSSHILPRAKPLENEMAKDTTDWRKLYLETNEEKVKFQEQFAECSNELRLTKTKLQELQAAQKPLPAHPVAGLRLKILETCTELQAFMSKHGDNVKVRRSPDEPEDVVQSRVNDLHLREARIKFTGDYRLNHGDTVDRLRNEIKQRCGISDAKLDDAIQFAHSGGAGSAEALTTVIERFWILALGVNC